MAITSLLALPLIFFKWRSSMSSTNLPLSILTSRMSKSLSLPSAVTLVLEDWRISMLATTEDSMEVNGVTSNWSVAERDDWAPVVLQPVKNTARSARVIVVFIRLIYFLHYGVWNMRVKLYEQSQACLNYVIASEYLIIIIMNSL